MLDISHRNIGVKCWPLWSTMLLVEVTCLWSSYIFLCLSMCTGYKRQCVSVLVSLRDYFHSLTPVQAPDWTETSWSLRSQHLLPYHLESRNWHRSDTQDREDVKKEQRRKPVEVAQLAYELYIKTVWMTDERQEWVEAVQSHSMCQRQFFFFSFPVSWHRLLGSQLLSQTPSVLK